MAPRRQYKRKRSSPAWYNKKYSIADIGKTVYKTAKTVATMINSEEHHYDYNVSSSSVVAGTINVVSNIPVSATVPYGTRAETQQQVKLNSITIRSLYESAIGTSTVSIATAIRFILLVDKQQVDNTSPAVLDVLETATIQSLLNRNNLTRFKILRDQVHVFSNYGSVSKFKEDYIKFPVNFHLRWGKSNEVEKNHIYVIMLGDTTDTAYTQNMRLNYHQN